MNHSADHNEQAHFETPRHWVTMDELSIDYWNDEKMQEKRGQEFLHKPIVTLEQLEKLDQKGFARREFLTIMGASMALASTACVRRPVKKIIPHVIRPEEIVPGLAYYYASTYTDHSGSYGLLVKNREGRPIKLEGNPDHPVNRGRLSSRVQAALLDLYDPDRLKNPLSNDRRSGSQRAVSWADADAQIGNRLKSASRVRVVTAPLAGDSARRLVDEFASAFREGAVVEYEPLMNDEIAEAGAITYGTYVVPKYRFDRADVVVSLGADFLGTWLSPVEFAAQWIQKRKLDSGKSSSAQMSKLVAFESNFSLTGANADQRFPVRAGDEYKIALALLSEISKRTGKFQSGAYTAEKAALEIGGSVTADAIRGVAEALIRSAGRSLVVAGSLPTKTQHAVALQVCVNLINSALGNEGSTVDGTSNASVNGSAARYGAKAMFKFLEDARSGKIEVAILNDVNLAYWLGEEKAREALSKIPLVVSVSSHADETSALVDYVLPSHHFLENWGDARASANVYGLQQPAIAPLHDTRAFEETLIAFAKAAKIGGGLLSRSASWYDYIRANWRETVFSKHGRGGEASRPAAQAFDAFWDATLQKGVLDVGEDRGGASRARSVGGGAIAALTAPEPQSAGTLTLALYEKVSMGDGRQANNAWLQELPDPISTITWDNYINVGPGLAKKLNLQLNDVVKLTGQQFELELPVNVQPGLHDDTVSVAVGYGRQAAGNVGSKVGANAFAAAQFSGERWVFSGQKVELKKTGRRYELAATQGHFLSEDRPIINDVTLADFKKSPKVEKHVDPQLRMEPVPTMWPKHEYKGHRWGMSIDLTSCIGCGACVTACQAENNVPVVGRDRVRMSREMHWIRIDRYYSGSSENPEVLFQPMTCQHCENAPCETVCPVLATVHDQEGVNQMVYARCVGTRYCANNCPYKVRRFNFFDYYKSYQEPLNLAYNPDVTVRMRGVMEKCTFCVQRINEARSKAKDKKAKIQDGAILTACQQTCPTDAIVFGDINDPESRVAKLQAQGHAFRSLEVLNTKPALSYLSKVRNKEGSAHKGGEHGHG